MRILVCGSRTWKNRSRMAQELVEFVTPYVKSEVIIHGGAQGADLLAEAIAKGYGLSVEHYDADWQRDGKAAGPLRNARMLREGKPDIVLAFWDGKSRGTADMIAKAQAARVPTRIILEFEA